ncbi:MAG: sulfite exporter TauE/SafE family protein [Gammaproteobacteria bacterium]
MQPKRRKRMLSYRRTAGALFLLVIVAGLGVGQSARADTVASLLGNFTINQFAGIQVDRDQVTLHFVVVLGQLPALAALHQADTNADGVTSQAERDAYVKRLAPGFARDLKLTVAGRPLPLHLVSWTSSLPSESTGFSLRFDAHYAGKIPAGLQGSVQRLRFDNTNYAGRIGWHEIVVLPGKGVSVFDTNAVSTSMTKGLSINPHTLPPGGPLDERAVHLAFTPGAPPAGVAMLQPRKGYPEHASGSGERSGIQATGVAVTWLNHATKQLVDLISARHVAPGIALLALLLAMLLGALHAFSPGHGKTVVGAYLIGSRGTARHAIFLGLTVTVTHTMGVFAVGLATLFASQFIVPEKLFPVLSLISGLLVVGIGLALFIRRFKGARSHDQAHARASDRVIAQDRREEPAPLAELMAADANLAPPVHGHAHAYAHEHDTGHAQDHSHGYHDYHDHGHEHGDHHEHESAHANDHGHHDHHANDHNHDHDHGHDHEHYPHHTHDHDHHERSHDHDALTHSHGGRVHTHLPPGAQGERVTWRSLLGLGISGGLIPCPSAMVLLLATIALHKTTYGLILVLAFSLGLAVSLTGVGMAFLYARRLFGRAKVPGRLVQVLPVVSAGIITCIGGVICYGAIAGVSISI